MLVLAIPALIFGSIVWWRLVERPATYGYVSGGVFGVLTALLTAFSWVLRFVMVWGLEMLRVGPVLLIVGFVVALVCTGGLIAGLPFMFARRHET